MLNFASLVKPNKELDVGWVLQKVKELMKLLVRNFANLELV